MSDDPAAGVIANFLAEDHCRLDRLLQAAVSHPGRVDRDTYDQFRAGLLRHIGMEEKLLLPALQRWRGGEPVPVAAKLRLDHGALATLLMPTPTVQILATMRRILADHNHLEEGPDGLYALCDRLPAPEMKHLWEALLAAPTVSVMRHSDSPAVMKTLEGALARAGYRLEPLAVLEKEESR
ncbi:MAG: hemerythrin domain-containing protein [Nitrospira sp.]|nr:hemerythrin domain-containing protein [Nitrospira sp.]